MSKSNHETNATKKAKEAVFMTCSELPETSQVSGYDFNKGIHYEQLLSSFLTTGYQATHMGQAIQIINEMVIH